MIRVNGAQFGSRPAVTEHLSRRPRTSSSDRSISRWQDGGPPTPDREERRGRRSPQRSSSALPFRAPGRLQIPCFAQKLTDLLPHELRVDICSRRPFVERARLAALVALKAHGARRGTGTGLRLCLPTPAPFEQKGVPPLPR